MHAPMAPPLQPLEIAASSLPSELILGGISLLFVVLLILARFARRRHLSQQAPQPIKKRRVDSDDQEGHVGIWPELTESVIATTSPAGNDPNARAMQTVASSISCEPVHATTYESEAPPFRHAVADTDDGVGAPATPSHRDAGTFIRPEYTSGTDGMLMAGVSCANIVSNAVNGHPSMHITEPDDPDLQDVLELGRAALARARAARAGTLSDLTRAGAANIGKSASACNILRTCSTASEVALKQPLPLRSAHSTAPQLSPTPTYLHSKHVSGVEVKLPASAALTSCQARRTTVDV